MAYALPVVGVVAALLSSAACAQVIGIEDTTLDSSGQNMGGSGGGGEAGAAGAVVPLPKACSGAEELPDVEKVSVSMHMTEFTSDSPVQGISARAFGSLTDFSTFKTSVACGVSDSAGELMLNVPRGSNGFKGFIYLTGTNQESFFYFFSPPLKEMESFTFLCLTNSDWAALRSALQLPDLSATHGQVTINALTSDGLPLAGVRFELDRREPDNTKPFYFTESGNPSLTEEKTSAAGFGGFFNVPAGGGAMQVRMVRASDNVELGSVDIYVYAGTWTTMRIKSREVSAEGG